MADDAALLDLVHRHVGTAARFWDLPLAFWRDFDRATAGVTIERKAALAQRVHYLVERRIQPEWVDVPEAIRAEWRTFAQARR